jgi:hypothetical protein
VPIDQWVKMLAVRLDEHVATFLMDTFVRVNARTTPSA